MSLIDIQNRLKELAQTDEDVLDLLPQDAQRSILCLKKSASDAEHQVHQVEQGRCQTCQYIVKHRLPCSYCQTRHPGDERLRDYYWPFDTQHAPPSPTPKNCHGPVSVFPQINTPECTAGTLTTGPAPRCKIQMSVKVTPQEWKDIKTHGGLTHVVRKFLADNPVPVRRAEPLSPSWQPALDELRGKVDKCLTRLDNLGQSASAT